MSETTTTPEGGRGLLPVDVMTTGEATILAGALRALQAIERRIAGDFAYGEASEFRPFNLGKLHEASELAGGQVFNVLNTGTHFCHSPAAAYGLDMWKGTRGQPQAAADGGEDAG